MLDYNRILDFKKKNLRLLWLNNLRKMKRLKIGILSYRALSRQASAEELRMQRVARAMGHTCRIFRAKRFQMVFDKNNPCLLYDGKKFPNYDVIITRPSVLNNVDMQVSLIRQMELAGLLVLNKFTPIVRTKNKIKTMQILNHHGIPIPDTVVVRRSVDLKQAVKILGGFPIIVKSPVGSFGSGVRIVESMRALKSLLLWDEPMYLLQQFVKFSKGKDIRIFVVNGQVVGTMMRSAKKGEFRSNIELGGKGESVEITEEEATIAIRSVHALELNYGGVDVIRSKNGPAVLEVNSNPGFKALEEASGADVAGALISYAVEYVEQHKNRTL
jgi:ribosomal protein S6--L-glutamate ligase